MQGPRRNFFKENIYKLCVKTLKKDYDCLDRKIEKFLILCQYREAEEQLELAQMGRRLDSALLLMERQSARWQGVKAAIKREIL